ncbi:OsmC family protein [Oleiagrimonas citrea]|uniref:OsmC family peroxiredoxin n=1 Tax=Oleiagrimonas citrea TaxID=1665687 RepID=A0A846ZIL9_9GAMM|nr:OsmC family protein [Oleiagrimonas citrea]NKZ37672.1 OsmC family peroxiredoxin [Oleiagrimonas citrea]
MSDLHTHRYAVELTWTGNRGDGTRDYRAYGRDHVLRIDGKPELAASADRIFRGDRSRHNPEDLLVAALSSCHMLSYLHMAAAAGIVVVDYADRAEGVMRTEGNGGRFVEVVLHPQVTIAAGSAAERAAALHEDAHHACFIANSVNFPVRCEPRIDTASS